MVDYVPHVPVGTYAMKFSGAIHLRQLSSGRFRNRTGGFPPDAPIVAGTMAVEPMPLPPICALALAASASFRRGPPPGPFACTASNSTPFSRRAICTFCT